MPVKGKIKRGARLDGDIARDIRQALKLDSDVPDERIRVQVQNGAATLGGNVEASLQKITAEADARKVKGVVDVVNRITVEAVTLSTVSR
jgi:osmotically-inducible protein OsmY